MNQFGVLQIISQFGNCMTRHCMTRQNSSFSTIGSSCSFCSLIAGMMGYFHNLSALASWYSGCITCAAACCCSSAHLPCLRRTWRLDYRSVEIVAASDCTCVNMGMYMLWFMCIKPDATSCCARAPAPSKLQQLGVCLHL